MQSIITYKQNYSLNPLPTNDVYMRHELLGVNTMYSFFKMFPMVGKGLSNDIFHMQEKCLHGHPHYIATQHSMHKSNSNSFLQEKKTKMPQKLADGLQLHSIYCDIQQVLLFTVKG